MATVRSIDVRISANSASYIGALKKAESVTRQFNKSVSSTGSAVASNTRSTKAATANLNGMARGGSAAFNTFQRLNGAVNAGGKAFSAASSQVGFFSKGLAGLKSIAISSIAALVGFTAIHTAINISRKALSFMKESIIDFNKAMVESTAIMGDLSDETVRSLENTALNVSKISTFTPKQAAEGLYFLASAGYDADQAMRLLPVSAKFAQAGVMELDKATEYLTDIQKAVSGNALDTRAIKNKTVLYDEGNIKKTEEGYKRVADVVTQTAIQSNATIDQVAQGLTGKLAPQLRLLNKPIEEGAAILAIYANQGIKGAVASTAGAMALRDLQTRALKNSDAFKKFGLSVYDSSGNMRNIADIIQNLEQILGGMNDEQKRATLLQLGFQDRSVAALLSLVGFSAQLRTTEKDLRGAGGAVDEVANKQLKSFSGQLSLLSNRLYRISVAVGKLLESGIKKIGSVLTPAFTALNEGFKKVGESLMPFIKIIGKVAGGAIYAGFIVLGKVLEFVGKVAQKFSTVIAGVISALVVLKMTSFASNLLKSFSSLTQGFSAFAKGFFAQSKGISLKGIAVSESLKQSATSGAAFYEKFSNNKFVKAFASGLDSIKNAALKVGNFLKPIGSAIASFASSVYSSMSSVASSVGSSILSGINSLKSFGSNLMGIVPNISAFAKGFIAQSQNISLEGIAVSESLNKSATSGAAFFTKIQSIGSNVTQFMSKPFSNMGLLFDTFKQKLSGVGPAFTNFGKNIGSSFKSAISTGAQFASSIGSSLLSFGSSLLSAGASAVTFSAKSIASFISTQISAQTMAGFVGAATTAMTFGLQAVLVVLPLLIMAFQQATQKAKDYVSEITKGIDTNTFSGTKDALDELGTAVVRLDKNAQKHKRSTLAMIGEVLNPLNPNEAVDSMKRAEEATLQYAKMQERYTNISANAMQLDREGLGIRGMSWDKYRERVSKVAADLGVDLGKTPKAAKKARERVAAEMQRVQNSFNLAGGSAADFSDMTTEELDAVEQKGKELADNFNKNLVDMFDPAKAYEQAKATTEAIYKAFETPQDVFNKLKENITKSVRSAFDAAQEQAKKSAKKAKKDYEKPDFEFTPKINATQFLDALIKESQKVEKFRNLLQNVRNLGGSSDLVQALSQMGEDAIPILESLANTLPSKARQIIQGLNTEFAKFNTTPEVTLEEFSASLDQQLNKSKKFIQDLVDLSKAGFNTEYLKVIASDPELKNIITQISDRMKLISLMPEGPQKQKAIQDLKDLTSRIYDSKNIETQGITKAVEAAMNAAKASAEQGAQAVMESISKLLGTTPDKVKEMLNMLTFLGIKIPGYTPSAPAGSGKTGAGAAGGGATGGGATGRTGGTTTKPPAKKNINPIYMGVVQKQIPGSFLSHTLPQWKVPSGWKGSQSPSPRTVTNGKYWVDQNNKLHRVGFYANGGIESHNAQIAKNGVRIWAEPETGGEAYIPLGMNKRAKSSQILEQVAQQFGYGLIKYANGGFFGTSGSQMIGGGRYGTQYAQTAQTIVVPVQSKNETNFNGPIVGVNMEDAVRFAERKKRQKALTR